MYLISGDFEFSLSHWHGKCRSWSGLWTQAEAKACLSPSLQPCWSAANHRKRISPKHGMLDTTVKDVYNRLWAIFIHVFEDTNDFQKNRWTEF